MSKKIVFQSAAWEEYRYWQDQDRKTIKKINALILDIERGSNEGIGKPEALRYKLQGWWSREIDEKNRLVYRVVDDQIEITQCKGHYDDEHN
jgi:toxin YoeB